MKRDTLKWHHRTLVYIKFKYYLRRNLSVHLKKKIKFKYKKIVLKQQITLEIKNKQFLIVYDIYIFYFSFITNIEMIERIRKKQTKTKIHLVDTQKRKKLNLTLANSMIY